MGEKTITVLIVDDHAVVRSGLKAILFQCDDLCLLGEAGSGEEAILLSQELNPDVILMDLVMPGLDGVETTEKILAHNPQIQIIALTSFPEGDRVQKVLKAGAISYLLKNVSGEELIQAIIAASKGQSVLAPEAAKALVEETTRPPAPDFQLTRREQDVLHLMVQGLSNSEMAENLIVSQSTIKFHVSNVISKLEATSRTEAVAIALRHGLVE